MEKIEINSPAKINFGLNIVERRHDGYHNIETIFYPIKLCDKIVFHKSDSDLFTCNDKVLALEKDNLILKAKRLIEKHFNKKFNLDINLIKNIPTGAGMGGGSSDAASTLHAVNLLFDLDLSKNDLNNFAMQIGSDVSFFLDPRPSFATSRGEKLTVIDFSINFPILIVNPGIHISTKWAYSYIWAKVPANPLHDFVNYELDFDKLKQVVTNDFEYPVFKKFPEVKLIKEKMYDFGAVFSLMTGSGSTVFGIFEDEEKARTAMNFFSKNYFTFLNSN